jgi:RNA polymerase sigma-70 factor (ECF subfamily)
MTVNTMLLPLECLAPVLPHRQRIHLGYFEGHSHGEIALVMNLPGGIVKSRIRVALVRLLERLL